MEDEEEEESPAMAKDRKRQELCCGAERSPSCFPPSRAKV